MSLLVKLALYENNIISTPIYEDIHSISSSLANLIDLYAAKAVLRNSIDTTLNMVDGVLLDFPMHLDFILTIESTVLSKGATWTIKIRVSDLPTEASGLDSISKVSILSARYGEIETQIKKHPVTDECLLHIGRDTRQTIRRANDPTTHGDIVMIDPHDDSVDLWDGKSSFPHGGVFASLYTCIGLLTLSREIKARDKKANVNHFIQMGECYFNVGDRKYYYVRALYPLYLVEGTIDDTPYELHPTKEQLDDENFWIPVPARNING